MGQRNVTKLLANLSKSHSFLCQFQNWIKVITLFNLKIEEPDGPEMKLVFHEMREYLRDVVDLYFESRKKMIRMFELCSVLKNGTKRINEKELTWDEVNDWELEENEYGDPYFYNHSTGETMEIPWIVE